MEYFGEITVKEMEKHEECAMTFYTAKMVTFNNAKKNTLDVSLLEKNNPCQSYPYLIGFTIKPDAGTVKLMASPDDKASINGLIHEEDLLMMIKKIDTKWVYAALYDGHQNPPIGDVKGYVEICYLQPLN